MICTNARKLHQFTGNKQLSSKSQLQPKFTNSTTYSTQHCLQSTCKTFTFKPKFITHRHNKLQNSFPSSLFSRSFTTDSKTNVNTKATTTPQPNNTIVNNKDENLVWIDLEMTGLDVEKDFIIELAVIVTDKHLNILAEHPEIVVHASDHVLDNMNEWCKEHHGKSGLTDKSRFSKITMENAEQMVIDFLKPHIGTNRMNVLSGNSVHVDKKFLDHQMPKLASLLHYRILDVSTVKELVKRWYPKEFLDVPPKQELHRALDDIRESIKELRFYKQRIFK